MDGSLGSTTAWFYDPYTDDPGTSGLLTTDTASLRRWALAGDEAGLHLIIHAIGDRANDWLLDVYEEAVRTKRPQGPSVPDRACPTSLPGGYREVRGVWGSSRPCNPIHAIDDGRWAEKRIGPERIKTTYAFRSLLDAGASLAFGSDWTVAPMDVTAGVITPR